MRNQNELNIRRAIIQMAVGETQTLPIGDTPPADAARLAIAFARNHKTPITADMTPDGMRITRVESWPRSSMYPELDALAVGESRLFDLPQAFHQRIRQAATVRNKTGEVRLSCAREGSGLRVTRLPLTEDEHAQCGPIQAPARPSKYELERLATMREIRFTVAARDQHKLRLAVSHKAKSTGWPLRCRLQDDGSMLVYRTDKPATPAP